MDLTKQSTEDLTCKVWNHNWDPSKGYVDEDGIFLKWKVPCDRCSSTKVLIIHRMTGMYSKGYYIYTKMYKIPGCSYTREERGALRLELIRRIFG